MQNFHELFAEALEIEVSDFQDDTLLADLDEWDSMAALGVIAFAAQFFDKRITGDQLDLCSNVGDVRKLVE